MERGAEMAVDVRYDREIAIGSMLHNCFGAMESALERLVLAIDGGLPTGSDFHAELIRRASTPIDGLRPAMISPSLAADLQQLRRFRHAFRRAYGDFDYARAGGNVPIASRAVTDLSAQLTEFAEAVGLVAGAQDGPPS
jgi:hypothetical protein